MKDQEFTQYLAVYDVELNLFVFVWTILLKNPVLGLIHN